MAKLTLDLNRFKASGIYTVEFDASDSITVSTQTVRLVVGFSRKGPFNAPVFLRDVKSARKIFGEIDSTLEKKGSFFHRSIETCLQSGPVFALNLLSLNNTPTGDKVDYRSFSLSVTEDNGETSEELMASFYNKERFWFADSSYFQALVNYDPLNSQKLLSFTNLSQKPVSIIVRKSKNIKGFDITARDFYGAGYVPEYVKEFDFLSDYFVDVIAVEGDWTNYANLSIDTSYSKYFNKNGIKANMLENFIADDSVSLVANITGCIIPDFTDKNGTNQFIETIVNNTVGTTGLFMTVNKDAFDDYENSLYKLDMIGHTLISTVKDSMNFLSYVSPITDELYYGTYENYEDELLTVSSKAADFNSDWHVKSYPFTTGNSSPFFNTVVIPKPKPSFTGQEFTLTKYSELIGLLNKTSLIKTYGSTAANRYVKVDTISNTGSSIEIITSNPKKNTIADAGVYSGVTISNVDYANNTIDITFPGVSPSVNPYDIIYIPTLNSYYVVKSDDTVGTPGATFTVELFTTAHTSVMTAIPEGAYYDKWLSTATGSMQLTSAQGTQIEGTTCFFCDFATHKNYEANIIEGADRNFEYIPSTSLMKHTGANSEFIEIYPGNKLYTDIKNKSVIDGDYAAADAVFSDFRYFAFKESVGDYGLPCYKATQYIDSDLTEVVTDYANDLIKVDNDFAHASYTRKASTENAGENIQTIASSDEFIDELVTPFGIEDRNYFIAFESAAAKIELNVPIIANSLNASATVFRITNENAASIEVGQYLVVNDDNDPRLTRVIKKIKKSSASTGLTEYEISVNEPVRIQTVTSVDYVTRYLPIPQIANNLQFTNLGGFSVTSYHMPGTPAQLEKIYGVIENTNLGDTLSDRELISFRYIVDTFAGGLEPMCGPKAILSRLAKRRQKCMAIINAPSIAEFIESTDPRFTDEPDFVGGNPKPILKPEYIASGGNLSLGPSFRFSLPDDENGAKFCGVFTPFLKIRENNKNKNVPPAADVSNNFIRKFLSGQPYAIAAGPRRGVISNSKLVGLEYEYLTADREYIEPFGLNPIITTRKTGPMIYGNNTAYQKTLTAFNNLHVRDLLITIEEAIEDVLANYVFEFNDASTRLEIRTIVDGYLQTVKNAGGVYDYMVIMDETNNTNEIIDQNVGIIDVGIEPARGLQKVINRVTVLKTGAISSGGFTVA